MSGSRTFSLQEASALFKIKYEKLSENVYNSANVLLARVKKQYDFVGRQKNISIPQSFSGGVGSGSLPQSNTAQYAEASIFAKKVYARVDIDRETIKAAMKDQGSYVRATKEVVEKGIESYMRNVSRILFNDGTGSLASIDGSTAVTGSGTEADPYVLVLADDTKEANIEERDLVHFENEGGIANLLEILEYDPANQTVKLCGASPGLDAGPTTGTLFMQNSRNNDPQGLRGVLDATSGSLYGVPVTRRWRSAQVNAGANNITVDIMNGIMLDIERRTGKVPNLILTSYLQFQKLLALQEDHKRYPIPNRAGVKDKNGEVLSFSGVQFMSTSGPIPVVAERFCEDDRMYFLNDNYICIYHRPDFGWFDDDGTVFLRKADSDEYEARYGGYFEVYINPAFHGVITNLSVA